MPVRANRPSTMTQSVTARGSASTASTAAVQSLIIVGAA
ncbi:hypothetical protein HSB1_03160 [Halogranum salarium B-1]|uniref:Uncharacterized protein n=1 Tax=Halogranum salarium B-1 TaxID=1210908 RepID=J2ZKN7_9EURY|nr:hypothetical protein HSB1_03160 [Halogranum salarium B-1]